MISVVRISKRDHLYDCSQEVLKKFIMLCEILHWGSPDDSRGFACLNALSLLRIHQMEPRNGGYQAFRFPLVRNSVSAMCYGPLRPAICLHSSPPKVRIPDPHLEQAFHNTLADGLEGGGHMLAGLKPWLH